MLRTTRPFRQVVVGDALDVGCRDRQVLLVVGLEVRRDRRGSRRRRRASSPCSRFDSSPRTNSSSSGPPPPSESLPSVGPSALIFSMTVSAAASRSVSECPGRGVMTTRNSPTSSFELWLAGHVRRGLLVVDERLGQARGPRAGQDRAEHVEGILVVVLLADGWPLHVETRAPAPGPRRRAASRPVSVTGSTCGLVIAAPCGIPPKYFATQALVCAGSKSPTIDEKRIVGRVVEPEEVLDVFFRRRREVVHAADDVPRVRDATPDTWPARAARRRGRRAGCRGSAAARSSRCRAAR